MPGTLPWTEIALRLALATLAGLLFGINRGEHGRPAGLRTTLLVCLAAAISMLQVNLLLIGTALSDNATLTLDLMRLPLGVLSGMGFIGGGAILRRDDRVKGVTTAATLWFVTMVGLCFGGGQIGLGLAGAALGLLVLWALKYLEAHWDQDREGMLTIAFAARHPPEQALRGRLAACGMKPVHIRVQQDAEGSSSLRFTLRYRRREHGCPPRGLIDAVETLPDVIRLEWEGD